MNHISLPVHSRKMPAPSLGPVKVLQYYTDAYLPSKHSAPDLHRNAWDALEGLRTCLCLHADGCLSQDKVEWYDVPPEWRLWCTHLRPNPPSVRISDLSTARLLCTYDLPRMSFHFLSSTAPTCLKNKLPMPNHRRRVHSAPSMLPALCCTSILEHGADVEVKEGGKKGMELSDVGQTN
jgi:hypothetical protein